MRNQTKILFLIIILLFSMLSCKKDLTELNVNPDQPLTTDPNYLFTYALQQGMGNYNSDVTLEQWGLMNWMMYMATRGGVEPGKEYVIPSGKDDFWREQYTNALSNSQVIIDMAIDVNNSEKYPGLNNMKAAAIIWKINLFHKLTDLWGDIPYSEALNGIMDLNLSPGYDRQQTIYDFMLQELQDAVDMFDTNLPFYTTESDVLYNGEMEKWIALGNSLQLRLATRINKVDFAKYTEVVNQLLDKDLIDSHNEAAIWPFNSVAKNHLYETMFRGESTTQNNPSRYAGWF